MAREAKHFDGLPVRRGWLKRRGSGVSHHQLIVMMRSTKCLMKCLRQAIHPKPNRSTLTRKPIAPTQARVRPNPSEVAPLPLRDYPNPSEIA